MTCSGIHVYRSTVSVHLLPMRFLRQLSVKCPQNEKNKNMTNRTARKTQRIGSSDKRLWQSLYPKHVEQGYSSVESAFHSLNANPMELKRRSLPLKRARHSALALSPIAIGTPGNKVSIDGTFLKPWIKKVCRAIYLSRPSNTHLATIVHFNSWILPPLNLWTLTSPPITNN